MQMSVCGISFRNPVLAASGTFGYGIEFEKLLDQKSAYRLESIPSALLFYPVGYMIPASKYVWFRCPFRKEYRIASQQYKTSGRDAAALQEAAILLDLL